MTDLSTSRATLDVHEAADFLRCAPSTVRQQIALGRLPAAKIGKAWVIRFADLTDFLAREVLRRAQATLPRETVNSEYDELLKLAIRGNK